MPARTKFRVTEEGEVDVLEPVTIPTENRFSVDDWRAHQRRQRRIKARRRTGRAKVRRGGE